MQNDTSLVTEAKYMRRWEFDSVAQSARCLSSWFPGTCNEQILLKDYLDATTGILSQIRFGMEGQKYSLSNGIST